ncbi:putative ATPase/DNA-binding SARP family transcriptional activator [Kibdelosporangium banguiense]|uniref:ATPase/DNA-binding SARP family transcriptional activator n=1 Tax=Kibdelosporangium banguiense TaxID=1365924 RepID=A0ABS4TGX2_9PSEU|nr:BTAD domain-containing putative transcriptional regulator [Kibdelosporangium banguiense]MBP2323285.1 putative ATPase/DNA-binding SARP family transcriptional activator [Kibdelosporangium banguiense]
MRDDVNVRLLGSLEVTGSLGTVPVHGAGHRTLVARLAAHPGETVPAYALIEALWGDSFPITAIKTLHSHLARLRRDLREAGLDGLIATRPPGYLLDIRPELVDAIRFESLALQGRQELEAGHTTTAARTLTRAKTLWRGEPLGDCRRSSWAQQESARLSDIHIGLQENLFSAQVSLGEHTEVVTELSTLVKRHPFRERLWELLMLALYRGGRQGEALNTYQRARAILVDQLGIEPGKRLQALEASILTGDPDLAPAETHTLVRRPVTSNLPADVTSFVSRDTETAEITWLLATSRMVNLVGVGGVGKSRLGLHVARCNQPSYPDGVWLVELAALNDPALVAHTVADVLDVHDQSGRDMTTVLAEHLRTRAALLVLDNCEHLVESCAVFVETLLRAAPGLRVLVTSRQALHVEGERVVIVNPLPVPDLDEQNDGHESPAVTLLVERADAALPEGFRLTSDNRAAVTALCQRLEGIPLAVELAARRLRVLSPEELLARLDDRFRLLTEGGRMVLARQQTLRATVDWSYELCSPAERLLWRRISVFAGSFDLPAVENICTGEDAPADTMLDAIAGLVDKSVLVRVEGTGAARYRLLETLRQYGHERLREADEEHQLRGRHRDWYLGLAEQGEQRWFSAAQTDTSIRTRLDHANLRAALEFCMTEPGEATTGLRLAGALWFYWIGSGLLAEGQHWLDWALSTTEQTSMVRPKALWVNGYVAALQGKTSTARELVAQMRPDADQTSQAHATFVLGAASVFDGDLTTGAHLLAEAHERHRELGDPDSNVIMTRVALAITVAFEGDLARAESLCLDARTICLANGEQWALAYAFWVLAFITASREQPVYATELARESLRIKHAFNDLLGVAVAIELLALLAVMTGDAARSAALLGAAHQIWPRVGAQLFGSAHFNATHQQCTTLTKQALGDLAFEIAFDRGASLRMVDAVTYALDDKAELD